MLSKEALIEMSPAEAAGVTVALVAAMGVAIIALEWMPHLAIVLALVVLLLYGMARGVPWQTMHKRMAAAVEQGMGAVYLFFFIGLLVSALMNAAVLLTLFYFLDRRYFLQAGEEIPKKTKRADDDRLQLFGRWNLLLLAGVVGAVLMSGIWKSGRSINILGTPYELQNLVRDIILIALTAVSLAITPKQVRAGNEFDFGPIAEVAKLFLGIFITIAPVLAMLQAAEKGAFAPLIALVHDDAGNPINTMYFWMSGILSGFLDNAPTYLVFFNMAGGDAHALMSGPLFHTLLAVSMGSVFMGALTYIGNAPNFMVKAIAEQRKVAMPGFFGYMAWSFGILVPLFAVQTLIFFVWQIF